MAERGYITTKRRKKEKNGKIWLHSGGAKSFGRKPFGRKPFGRLIIWLTHYLADSLFGRLIIWPTHYLVEKFGSNDKYILAKIDFFTVSDNCLSAKCSSAKRLVAVKARWKRAFFLKFIAEIAADGFELETSLANELDGQRRRHGSRSLASSSHGWRFESSSRHCLWTKKWQKYQGPILEFHSGRPALPANIRLG